MRTQARLERLEIQVGVSDSSFGPDFIRIFETLDCETEAELEARVDEYIREHGKNNVEVGRDDKDRIIAIVVNILPDHRALPDKPQQPVIVQPPKATKPKQQAAKPELKPKPEPELEPDNPTKPELTAGERRRRRRQKAFARWRRGE